MTETKKVRAKITGEVQMPSNLLEDVKRNVKSIGDLQARLEDAEKAGVSKLFLFLLTSAIVLRASDIHLEVQEENTRLRLRIDGMLQDIATLSARTYETLLSRIKLLSGIKLNVTDRPQDGRLSFIMQKGLPIEIRSSTLPSEYGESIVLRILNPQTLIGLGGLGLRKDLLSIFAKEIAKPNGMIIVTGPTGSGKTTTLYAFLKKVQKPAIKIITIEDPIEYHLENVSQTQVKPEKGYDFASGLRAIVRQDPDVILVGEIRDKETAEIAVQAALTGHLVFSTLHTNDAAGTISRFLSLGAKPSNIASSINLIIAQRLVRKVCKACVTLRKISVEEKKKFVDGLRDVPTAIKPKALSSAKIPVVKGCKKCNSTGYMDRIGIFEAIQITPKMEAFIITTPSIGALKEFAKKEGMITMYQDGLLKILEGITTLEEVERVSAD